MATVDLFMAGALASAVALILAEGSAPVRLAAVAATAAAVWAVFALRKSGAAAARARRAAGALRKLPSRAIVDAQVPELTGTPARGRYAHLERNERIVGVVSRLRGLRGYNDHTFAAAMAYLEHFLLMSRRAASRQRQRCRRRCKGGSTGDADSADDTARLVLLKDRVLNTLGEFALVVPAPELRRMRFDALLHVLDVAMFTEGIQPLGRVQDVYPYAADPAAPWAFSGH